MLGNFKTPLQVFDEKLRTMELSSLDDCKLERVQVRGESTKFWACIALAIFDKAAKGPQMCTEVAEANLLTFFNRSLAEMENAVVNNLALQNVDTRVGRLLMEAMAPTMQHSEHTIRPDKAAAYIAQFWVDHSDIRNSSHEKILLQAIANCYKKPIIYIQAMANGHVLDIDRRAWPEGYDDNDRGVLRKSLYIAKVEGQYYCLRAKERANHTIPVIKTANFNDNTEAPLHLRKLQLHCFSQQTKDPIKLASLQPPRKQDGEVYHLASDGTALDIRNIYWINNIKTVDRSGQLTRYPDKKRLYIYLRDNANIKLIAASMDGHQPPHFHLPKQFKLLLAVFTYDEEAAAQLVQDESHQLMI